MKIKTVNVYVTQVIGPDPSSPPTADPDNKINFLQDNTEVIARLNEDKDLLEEQLEEQEHANQVLRDRIVNIEKDWGYDRARLQDAQRTIVDKGRERDAAIREHKHLLQRFDQVTRINSETAQRNGELAQGNSLKAMYIRDAKALIQEAKDRYREKHDPSQGDEIVTRLNDALDTLAGKKKEGSPDGD